MAATNNFQQLTQSDIDHFMQHGWLKLSNCFTQEQADNVTANLWTRLGMDPEDKSTWHTERINMPQHGTFAADKFAPKAWAAICDLVGGEDRIADYNREWNDGLIVNLGTPEGDGKDVPGEELPGWHVDGDFFVHYLDSPEQGLLVIPLFTDINPGGGGTMICPAAIPKMAKYLHEHPEGVSPRMTPREQNPTFEPEQGLHFFCDVAQSVPKDAFVETSGKVGDVYLLHPLMLHSASNNKLRQLRIITNPPVSLKEPFRFDREDGSEYSTVEQKTRAALAENGITTDGWKITSTRDKVVPERLRRQAKMREQELQRLEELKAKDAAGVGVTNITPSKQGDLEFKLNA